LPTAAKILSWSTSSRALAGVLAAL